LLDRYVEGGRVLDPFAGSGTTLVQALESGLDATGVDIAAFNALLMRVKVGKYDLERLRSDLVAVHQSAVELRGGERYPRAASTYARDWFAPAAANELLAFRSLVGDLEHADVLRVVLARAARSARRTTHFDLEFPRRPQLEEYWCHKHRRTCRPVVRAAPFLARYALDTLARIEEFDAVRAPARRANVIHADARAVDLGGPYDGVITSPPYPGLIDYHAQHSYAYDLLGLEERGEDELGTAWRGTSRAALRSYCEGVASILARARDALAPKAPVLIVGNDRRDLYPGILELAGLRLRERLERHVNRRTGRRAGEYFESVLVAAAR
jgi:hypothetical protein